MSDPRPPGEPDYKVYRARRRAPWAAQGLEALRERRERWRERKPREPGEPRRITLGRVVKWVVLAIAGWLLLSLLLFLLSAQLEEGISDRAESALTGGGNLLSGSTILVIGSDQRSPETAEPGSGGPARADSIMLLHAAFGSVRKLSIPRDSFAEIPGHTAQKINAAYAFGGAGLLIDTVEGFMGNGLEINHVVEVSFEDFPELVDALGGITVTAKNRICAPPFGNFVRGLRFKKGENEVNGTRALGFARVRKNPCAPQENDLDRAERQQQVLSGIRSKLLSPSTFLRLPLVSWRAPKTLRTDMGGPSLMALFGDLATGNSDETPVLRPSCLGCGPGSSLLVSEGERAAAVDELLGR